ncbi:MAG: hypothetical protein WAN27_21040, partial [Xanthobacteraceae bacterium]
ERELTVLARQPLQAIALPREVLPDWRHDCWQVRSPLSHLLNAENRVPGQRVLIAAKLPLNLRSEGFQPLGDIVSDIG